MLKVSTSLHGPREERTLEDVLSFVLSRKNKGLSEAGTGALAYIEKDGRHFQISLMEALHGNGAASTYEVMEIDLEDGSFNDGFLDQGDDLATIIGWI